METPENVNLVAPEPDRAEHKCCVKFKKMKEISWLPLLHSCPMFQSCQMGESWQERSSCHQFEIPTPEHCRRALGREYVHLGAAYLLACLPGEYQ